MTITRIWTYQTECGESLRFCRISPDARYLICGGYDNAASLIRIQDRCILWKIKRRAPVWGCCWSMNSSQIALCGMDKNICLIDVNTGIVTSEIPRGQWLYCIDWSSDGNWIAAGGLGPPASSYQEEFRKISSSSQPQQFEQKNGVKLDKNGEDTLLKHEKIQHKYTTAAVAIDIHNSISRDLHLVDALAVWCIRYSPDAQCLALGTSQGGVSVFAPDGSSTILEIRRKTDVRGLAFTADSTALAIACLDGTICVVDWQHSEIVYEAHAGGPAIALDFVGHQGDLLIGRWYGLNLIHLDLVQGGTRKILQLERVPTTTQSPLNSTYRTVNSLSAVVDLHVHTSAALLAYARTDGVLVAVPLLLPPPLGAYVLAFRFWPHEYAMNNYTQDKEEEQVLNASPLQISHDSSLSSLRSEALPPQLLQLDEQMCVPVDSNQTSYQPQQYHHLDHTYNSAYGTTISPYNAVASSADASAPPRILQYQPHRYHNGQMSSTFNTRNNHQTLQSHHSSSIRQHQEEAMISTYLTAATTDNPSHTSNTSPSLPTASSNDRGDSHSYHFLH